MPLRRGHGARRLAARHPLKRPGRLDPPGQAADTPKVVGTDAIDVRQDGFTLVEVLVAALVVAVGVLGLLGALTASGRLTGEAKRTEQATAVGQRAIAAIKALDYARVGLTSKPVHEATGPNARVTGTTFSSGAPIPAEELVAGGSVPSAPESFESGNTTGTIFRYVTERTECGLLCSDTLRSKRVTVAVWLSSSRGHRPPPVYVSTVMTDPDAGPLGVSVAPPTANPGAGAPITGQQLYLTDTSCNVGTRQPIAGAHATHDTSATTASCTSINTSRPDLLDPDGPPETTTPLPDLSNDLSRTSPLGLGLRRSSATCPTTGSKFEVHTWATAPLPLAFTVVGRSALSVHTRTVGGVAGGATLCATLRAQTAGLVTTTVATTTYHLDAWPTEDTPIAFAFDNLSVPAIALGGRLLLTVSLRASATGPDIELLYDHPDQRSVLTVSTTTPLP